MDIRLFLVLLSTTAFLQAFEAKQYKQFLGQTKAGLEKRRKALDKKMEAFKKPARYPLAGSFGLSEAQLASLKASRAELGKQLTTRHRQLTERIETLEKAELPKTKTEETKALERASLEQQAADLQDRINDISLTQSLLEKQQETGPATALIQQWAAKRTELETRLKNIQAQLSALTEAA